MTVPSMKLLKAVIADDHVLFRQGLKFLLEEFGISVVGEVADFASLSEVCAKVEFDLLICDCKMPRGSILSSVKEVKRNNPESKIIILTGLESQFLFNQLLAFGVNGVCVKSTDVDEIANAIEFVSAGDTYVSKRVTSYEGWQEGLLTNKEFEVMQLILLGLNNNEVAIHLGNSERTINVHRANIMKKLNLSNAIELANFAYKNALVENCA